MKPQARGTLRKMTKTGAKSTQFRLQALSNPQLRDFVKVSRILNEDWALGLLKHAAGPNSPIDVNNLPPVDKSEPLIVSTLHDFEDHHLLQSQFERHGNTIRRVFHITPLGKRVVEFSR